MAGCARLLIAASLLWGLCLPLGAAADAVVDLVWIATDGAGVPGSSSIEAESGDTITGEILVSAGPEGISILALSLAFDVDGGDELDLVSALETCSGGSCGGLVPFTPGVAGMQDSAPGLAGSVDSYESGTLGLGPVDSTFTLGTVTFLVTDGVSTDGEDLLAGEFNVGSDGVFDNAGVEVTPFFNGASVDAPAPGPPALGALALAALALRLAARPTAGRG